jgi:hypothetical protein
LSEDAAKSPAVVELRFADEEPIRSFIDSVSSALGLFSGVDDGELPEAARLAVMELRAACEAVGAAAPARTAPGGPYRGVINIEWPAAHGASPYSSMAGRLVSVTDALTGNPIRTCTGIVVRVDMESLITADLTMFATGGGLPLLDGEPVLDGREIRAGVFPFLVSEMRVRPKS